MYSAKQMFQNADVPKCRCFKMQLFQNANVSECRCFLQDKVKYQSNELLSLFISSTLERNAKQWKSISSRGLTLDAMNSQAQIYCHQR